MTLVDGSDVMVRPAFDLLKEYLDESFDLQTTSEVCRIPPAAIQSLARQLAQNRGKSLLAAGMGPNHYFNNDLFGRVHFLVAALTDNIGHIGGNVGSYAGNYRGSLFQAMPQWILENPFDIEPDLTKPARVKKYYKAESAHYWNYGERPLRAVKTGDDVHKGESITGKSHMPTPTKLIWFGNSNSLLGNAKWSFDVVKNTLPRQDAIFCNEWHWTSSCEYADMVFDGIDEHRGAGVVGPVGHHPLDAAQAHRGELRGDVRQAAPGGGSDAAAASRAGRGARVRVRMARGQRAADRTRPHGYGRER